MDEGGGEVGVAASSSTKGPCTLCHRRFREGMLGVGLSRFYKWRRRGPTTRRQRRVVVASLDRLARKPIVAGPQRRFTRTLTMRRSVRR